MTRTTWQDVAATFARYEKALDAARKHAENDATATHAPDLYRAVQTLMDIDEKTTTGKARKAGIPQNTNTQRKALSRYVAAYNLTNTLFADLTPKNDATVEPNVFGLILPALYRASITDVRKAFHGLNELSLETVAGRVESVKASAKASTPRTAAAEKGGDKADKADTAVAGKDVPPTLAAEVRALTARLHQAHASGEAISSDAWKALGALETMLATVKAGKAGKAATVKG